MKKPIKLHPLDIRELIKYCESKKTSRYKMIAFWLKAIMKRGDDHLDEARAACGLKIRLSTFSSLAAPKKPKRNRWKKK